MNANLIIALGNKIVDPRKRLGKVKYTATQILFMTFIAVLAGCREWGEIADFCDCQLEFIRRYFPDLEKTPSHDTFNRFFSILKSKEFEKAFREWITEYFPTPKGTVCIDGKAIRGAAKYDPRYKNSKDPSPIDMVTLWSREYGISFGQLAVEEKSNEITAIPKLLALMDLVGCVVTIDAMGCQKDIADAILKTNADFLLACKGNQEYLNETARSFFDNQEENLKHAPEAENWYHSVTTEDKGHGRLEKREVTSFGQPGGGNYFEKELNAPKPWKGINAFVRVRSTRTIMSTGETSIEDRYYITSLKAEQIDRIAASIRDHWSIENQLHWQLDVTFGEDESRRIGNAAQNMSIINKTVLSTIKLFKEKTKSKKSMKNLRMRAGWDISFLQQVIETAVWPKSDES